MIAYDAGKADTYCLVPKWVRTLKQLGDSVPMCVVGMKAEEGEDCRLLAAAQHTTAFLKARGIPVLTLNAKSGHGLLAPLEWLLRQACKDDTLTLLDQK